MSHPGTLTSVVLGAWVMVFGTGVFAQAQSAADSSVRLADEPRLMQLSIEPGQDDQILLILVVQGEGGCVFPQLFELPIQLDGTAFQLKRMLRTTADPKPDGSCLEGLGTVYRSEDYVPLGQATSVVLHLPSGPVVVPDEAMALVHARLPKNPPAPERLPAGALSSAAANLARILASGQGPRAYEMAESLGAIAATRPASEGIDYYSVRGSLRKAAGDLTGAALCFEIVTRIAEASGNTSPMVGVTWDNLATLRRQLKDYPAATAASDRALAILAARNLPREHGVAMHNRALLASAQGLAQDAYEWEERAFPLIEAAFRNDPAELKAFREDRKRIAHDREQRR